MGSMKNTGVLLSTLCLLIISSLPAIGQTSFYGNGFNEDGQPDYPPETDNLTLLNWSQSGDAFYIVLDSIESSGPGQLSYIVIGKNLRQTNGKDYPTQRSTNRMNCTNGTFQSALHWEQLDQNGNVIQHKDLMQSPKVLTASSALYDILKDACSSEFPQQPINW